MVRTYRGGPKATCSIDGCATVGKIVRGMCHMHYCRWKRHGDPTISLRPRLRQTDKDALLRAAATAKTDECILLLTPGNNRSSIVVGGRHMLTARAVWIMANGDPGDSWVLHSCNGGSGAHGCINIRHLYLGTTSDNTLDAVMAGTLAHQRLTPEDVQDIRLRYATGNVLQREIAVQFGVSRATVNDILCRRTWTHLP